MRAARISGAAADKGRRAPGWGASFVGDDDAARILGNDAHGYAALLQIGVAVPVHNGEVAHAGGGILAPLYGESVHGRNRQCRLLFRAEGEFISVIDQDHGVAQIKKIGREQH